LTVEEASGPAVEIWPDNLLSVNSFIALSTQWRCGYSGPTGLDYAAIPGVLQMLGIARKDWPEVFQDLRTMEDAALLKMHENQK
jgi:hypothetical protein